MISAQEMAQNSFSLDFQAQNMQADGLDFKPNPFSQHTLYS
jgi:hypothetical protein